MFGALLAYGVMGPDRLGWHWYLGLAAIPLALVLLFFPVYLNNIFRSDIQSQTVQRVM